VNRPGRHRHGLMDPPCRERDHLPQLVEGNPFHRMCVVCGRITAREDVDGLPWCGAERFSPTAL
jgi:hypothetical protein